MTSPTPHDQDDAALVAELAQVERAQRWQNLADVLGVARAGGLVPGGSGVLVGPDPGPSVRAVRRAESPATRQLAGDAPRDALLADVPREIGSRHHMRQPRLRLSQMIASPAWWSNLAILIAIALLSLGIVAAVTVGVVLLLLVQYGLATLP